jgi:hypothetical protein
MESSQTWQATLRSSALIILLAVLAALAACGSRTPATTRPTAMAVFAPTTPTHAAEGVVTARIADIRSVELAGFF